MGEFAEIEVFYRNTGPYEIKTFGPVIEYAPRFINCRSAKPIEIPKRWQVLAPGETRFLTTHIPKDVGISEQLVGDHSVVVRLGHTSDGERFEIERRLDYTILLGPVGAYEAFEEFWQDKEVCDSWAENKKVAVRAFNYDEASAWARGAAYDAAGIRPSRTLTRNQYRKVIMCPIYQDLLRLSAQRGTGRDYREIFSQLREVVSGRLPYSQQPFERHFLVELPYEIKYSDSQTPRIRQAIHVAYHSGVSAAAEHLRSLPEEALSCSEGALIEEMIRILHKGSSERLTTHSSGPESAAAAAPVR